MDENTLWKIRFACGLGSFLCLCVASGVSGLYHCEDDLDLDSCLMLLYKVGSCVVGFWIVCAVILGLLYLVRRWLRGSARRSDRHGRRLNAFLHRLAVEVFYAVAATLMPVASVALFDKIPKKNKVVSCAILMSSVLLLSYTFLEFDDFGLHDAVESIFLPTLSGFGKGIYIAAGICSLWRLAIFLSKEWLRWYNRRNCERLIDMLGQRLNDPEAISMLDNLRTDVRTR